MSRYLDVLNRWLGFPLAVLGLGLSWYFYDLAKVEVDPTFVVDPENTVIVERNRLSDTTVRVVRADGTPVESDVTSVRAYLWNAGRKPILPADVLDPLRIHLSSAGEILDFKILKRTRGLITQTAVARVTGVKDAVEVSFRLLEHGDGAAFQLLIAGDVSPVFELQGTVVGARSISTNSSIASSRYWVGPFRMLWIIIGLVTLPALLLDKLPRAVARAAEQHEKGDKRVWSWACAQIMNVLRRFGMPVLVALLVASLGGLLWVVVFDAKVTANKTVTEAVPAELRIRQ